MYIFTVCPLTTKPLQLASAQWLKMRWQNSFFFFLLAGQKLFDFALRDILPILPLPVYVALYIIHKASCE